MDLSHARRAGAPAERRRHVHARLGADGRRLVAPRPRHSQRVARRQGRAHDGVVHARGCRCEDATRAPPALLDSRAASDVARPQRRTARSSACPRLDARRSKPPHYTQARHRQRRRRVRAPPRHRSRLCAQSWLAVPRRGCAAAPRAPRRLLGAIAIERASRLAAGTGRDCACDGASLAAVPRSSCRPRLPIAVRLSSLSLSLSFFFFLSPRRCLQVGAAVRAQLEVRSLTPASTFACSPCPLSARLRRVSAGTPRS